MKKSVLLPCLGLLAALGAQAQEVGRVLASTPVIQQVAVPRQVCGNPQVVVQQPHSGAGSLMGAIAGGAVGNAIGDGSGRAAATMLGVIGGAVLGNRIEGAGSQVQNMARCTTQTFHENRAVAYNVTYEYAGRQYTVQMPQDPGPTIRLQVTPVGVLSTGPGYAQPYAGGLGTTTITSATTVYPPPYPGYYVRPSYPVGVFLNFGYGSHRHRHSHHH